MKRIYQIVDRESGSWWNISADKNQAATLFESREEAQTALIEVAKSLDCPPEELGVIERETRCTLQEWAEDKFHVCVYWSGVGCPMGQTTIVGEPDVEFVDRRGLLDLHGSIDIDGDWVWDGKGNPTDDAGNGLTQIIAFVDAETWESVLQESGK